MLVVVSWRGVSFVWCEGGGLSEACQCNAFVCYCDVRSRVLAERIRDACMPSNLRRTKRISRTSLISRTLHSDAVVALRERLRL